MSCEEELCKVSFLSNFKLACYIIDSDNVTRETYFIVQENLENSFMQQSAHGCTSGSQKIGN